MKALTLWQPMATAIALGPKRIENRPWQPPLSFIGETFLIHAGNTYDRRYAAMIAKLWPEMPRDVPAGAIIGSARVIGVLHLKEEPEPFMPAQIGLFGEDLPPAPKPPEISVQTIAMFSVRVEELAERVRREGDPWFFGPFGWILDNVRAFDPIKCGGRQKLWDPPYAIVEEARAAITRSPARIVDPVLEL